MADSLTNATKPTKPSASRVIEVHQYHALRPGPRLSPIRWPGLPAAARATAT